MHKADFPAELKGFYHIWMYLISEEVDSLQVSTWFDDLHRAWGCGAGAGKGVILGRTWRTETSGVERTA